MIDYSDCVPGRVFSDGANGLVVFVRFRDAEFTRTQLANGASWDRRSRVRTVIVRSWGGTEEHVVDAYYLYYDPKVSQELPAPRVLRRDRRRYKRLLREGRPNSADRLLRENAPD